jgi:hypothetical protein
VSENILQSSVQLVDELRRMLNGYIAFLKRSKRGENKPGSHNVHEGSAIYSLLEAIEYTDNPSPNHQLPNNQSPDPILPDA